MMKWQPRLLSDFLIEKKERIKHVHANRLGLQRIKKIDFSGNLHLDAVTETKTDMIRVKPGDLVISGINAAKGAIAIYEGEQDVLATIHYSAYQFHSDRISIEFLKWFFKSAKFSDLLNKQVPGGIKTEIKPKHILPLQIKFPTLSNQIFSRPFKIANGLNRFLLHQSKLDCEIVYQETHLIKLKQAILQEAIRGKLTADWRKENPDVEPASQLLERIHKEKQRLIAEKKIRKEKPQPPITPEKIPFEIPETWLWCHLGDIAIHSLGKMLDKGKNKGKLMPYIRNLNVQWFDIQLHDLKQMRFEDHELEKYAVERGDIVICEGGYPGRAAIWQRNESIMFQKALHRVRFILSAFDSRLFVCFLKLADEAGFLASYFTGAGIKHFTGKALHRFLIPLPPLVEQDAIVERVESLMDSCRQLETEIKHSQTHAENLLQVVLKEAFTSA